MAKLLRVPIEQYNDVIELLQHESYGGALRLLDRRGQRQIAAALLQNIIEQETRIETEECVEKAKID